MSNKDIPKIDIIYEDEDCVLINKPPGIMVHSDGRSNGPFITDWVVSKYPKAFDVGEPISAPDGSVIHRAGIVHRLDRDTSGAMIIAKNQDSHSLLKKQFQDRVVSKKYLAFVWGEIKEEFGTIDRPIGRSGSDFRKWSAQRGIRGETREAETYWTRIWTGQVKVEGSAMNEKVSLLVAEPKTGRTHQIRVHFTATNHPIIGDFLYAPNRPYTLGFERIALHSWKIEFNSMDGKRIKVEAPLPADFKKTIGDLGIKLV